MRRDQSQSTFFQSAIRYSTPLHTPPSSLFSATPTLIQRRSTTSPFRNIRSSHRGPRDANLMFLVGKIRQNTSFSAANKIVAHFHKVLHLTKEEVIVLYAATQQCHGLMQNIQNQLTTAVEERAEIENSIVRSSFEGWSYCNELAMRMKCVLEKHQSNTPILSSHFPKKKHDSTKQQQNKGKIKDPEEPWMGPTRTGTTCALFPSLRLGEEAPQTRAPHPTSTTPRSLSQIQGLPVEDGCDVLLIQRNEALRQLQRRLANWATLTATDSGDVVREATEVQNLFRAAYGQEKGTAKLVEWLVTLPEEQLEAINCTLQN